MAQTKLEVLLLLKDKMSAQVNTIRGKMANFARSVRQNWLGVAASIFVVQRALRALISPAIDFEDAFAGVRKTVDATNEEFDKLSDNLLNMSRRIPIAAKDLAGIQEIAGQLGIRGVKNLTKFTEAIAKISVTTNLTQEAAATSFARIAAVIGEPIENIENMASAVVDLGNQFPVTESEILNFAQRIAGMGKVAKLTTDELFGISAAFSSVGIQAEAGGTAINKVLLQLTSEGKTGGEEFVKFVNKLVNGTDNIKETLEELGLVSARSQQAFISLAGAGGQLEKALSIANEATILGIALNEEAAKKFGTTAQKIKLIKNNIEFLTIEIGTKLLPVFEDLLKVTVAWVDKLTGADLNISSLQILENSLRSINGIIEERNESLARFNPLISTQYKEQTERLVRQRAALVGLIQEERNRIDQQILGEQPIQGPEERPKGFGITEEESGAESFTERFKRLSKAFSASADSNKNKMEETVKAIQATANQLSASLSKAFSDPFAGLISGALTAKEAIQQLGQNLVAIIANYIAETLIAFTIGKSIQAVATALGIAQATALAAAWAPAAVFASIATFGAAAAAGTAGIITTFAASTGLAIAQKATLKGAATFHDGGVIRAHNGLAVDEVPIIAQTGEGILSRQGLRNLGGASELNRLNGGEATGAGGEGVTVNIYNPRFNDKADIKELTGLIGVEIDRQLRYSKGF